MTPTVQLLHPDRFYIGGQWLSPSTEATFDVLNSATERFFLRVAEAREADAERAVAAARRAFDEGPWPQMSPQERAGYLRALGAEVDARAQDTAVALACEVGMIFPMAQMMARMPGATYSEVASYADRFAFEEKRACRIACARACWRRRRHRALERSCKQHRQQGVSGAALWLHCRGQGFA